MRRISSSGSQAAIALPIDCACGAVDPAELAGLDAHGVTRFAHREHGDDVALQTGEMHGLAGGKVDVLEIGLRAAGQIDLQAGVPDVEDAAAERVKPLARHLGDEVALDQASRADGGRSKC